MENKVPLYEPCNKIKQALLEAKSDEKWPKLTKNKAGQFTYADLPHILELVEPLLHKHGLVLNFEPQIINYEEYQVVKLCHPASGMEIEAYSKLRPGADDKKWGGSKTYQKRYLILDILGIAVSGDYDPDQDKSETLSPKDVERIQKAIKDHAAPVKMPLLQAVLKTGNVKDLNEIDSRDVEAVLDFIKNWKP